MTITKFIIILGAIGFSTALIWGFIVGDFWVEAKEISTYIWGLIMLIDLYIGLLLMAVFIYLSENSVSKALTWIFFVLILGNITSLIYLLYRYKQIKLLFNGVTRD